MLRDRGSHRFGRDVGGQEAKAVEVRVDLAGRGRERDVAVVAGVRRMDRPDEPMVRALREQPALELRAPRVGGDDRQRGVGLLFERVAPRESRRVPSGALEPAIMRPSSSNTSPTAFTTTSAPTTTSPSRRARGTEAAGHRVLAAAPLADGRAATRAHPPDRERSGRLGQRGGERGATFLDAGQDAAGRDEVEDRRRGHERDRPTPRGEAAAELGQAPASRRRR